MILPPQDNPPLADQLAVHADLQHVPREAFAGVHALLVGTGAIGRPLSMLLAERGVRRFTLIDPKRYRSASIISQCQPLDVGRCKADVVANLLRATSADVEVSTSDIYGVPDGVVRPETVVVVSADNRRADIGANRLATRMRARGLIKANVEPRFHTASVRIYSPRRDPTRCIECLFTRAVYDRQRHPRSCDGGGEGRSTASPRSLTAAAATLGSTAFGQLLVGGVSPRRCVGHQWQFSAGSGRLSVSELMPHRQCGWSHSNHWPNVRRCRQSRALLSLQQLAEKARFTTRPEQLIVRCCREVALRARCVGAGHTVALVRWTEDLDRSCGLCPTCGTPLRASPFYCFESLAARQLASVWQRPLAEWGVGRHAVIQLQDGDRKCTFVMDQAASQNRETP